MSGERTPSTVERLILLETQGPDALVGVDRFRTIIVIPFAPVEYHGRHLPFSTDLILAESFSRSSAEAFLADNPQWNVVVYPTVPLGADCVPHHGSVEIPHRVIERAAMAVARHFIRHGFFYIVLMSGHGGVHHDRALERASRKLNRRYKKRGVRVIAPLGRVMFRFWAEGVRDKVNPLLERKVSQEEEKDFVYELHGGWWETSMVLARHPERMDERYRTTPDLVPKINPWLKILLGVVSKILPPVHRQRLEEVRDLVLVGTSWFWGNTSLGYLGFPSRARPEMGHAVTKVAGEQFAALFTKIFIDRAEVREAQSVYAILDVLFWYGVGLACVLLALVVVAIVV